MIWLTLPEYSTLVDLSLVPMFYYVLISMLSLATQVSLPTALSPQYIHAGRNPEVALHQ